jgi:predicted DNA-binding protein with PD1-like motif
MQSGESSGVIPVRLEPGENVHAALLEACRRHGLECGFVVSGIGMLEDPELGFLQAPGDYDHRRFSGKFELLNLSGNVAINEGQAHAHLHVTLGNPDYSVFGGHLFSAMVGVTIELLVLRVPDALRLERQFEEASGVPGLYIRSA